MLPLPIISNNVRGASVSTFYVYIQKLCIRQLV
ncbi:hypothetical protein pEaSNUABM12_00485 [Erwinia phage pEa_SNUABM_12]|uniref:Uncharacterized protein n=1 Tax=Erwinia phage pEa_SNUABM_12 TaxID=2768773 RepID=A0A7L8ZMJ9_9CAUD|nr:hypothetical protein pEaSNUABM12_00485 [Erwinia phage pEa_SNUABM_12]